MIEIETADAKIIKTVVTVLRNGAKARESNGDYSGSISDNRVVLAMVDAIEFALTGTTSNLELKSAIIIAKKELARTEAMKDPEWAEYTRLKSKFKNVD